MRVPRYRKHYRRSTMIDKLPYTLTDGVTATRDGLVVDAAVNQIAYHVLDGPELFDSPECLITWPDAAERLRYREGEPYVSVTETDDFEWVMWCETHIPNAHGRQYALHRLAAIICDDAEAFRVLHWCAKNLGGNK